MASIIQHPAKTNHSDKAAKANATKATVMSNAMPNNEEITQPQPQADAAAGAACLVAILELNETGIELFRLLQQSSTRRTISRGNTSNTADDDDHPHDNKDLLMRRSLNAFQEAASKLAPLIDTTSTSKIAEMLRQVTDVIDTASLQDKTKKNPVSHQRVSPQLNSHHQHHDYEQTDLISLKGFPIEGKRWISTASAVVLHNLGLVLLAIKGKVINLSPLTLCLDLSKQQTDSNDAASDDDAIQQQSCQVLLCQVQASANYLMGLTLYQKSCITPHQEKKEEQKPSKEEMTTKEGSSPKRRKLMAENNNDDTSAATKLHHQHQNNKMMLLYKSLEYALDGLGAMNDYQSHLMVRATYPDSSKSPVDTTSIPIGLFYILGQVYLRLNMCRDAQLAFQRCSWFVQSRQHQLVADEMLMGAEVKTNSSAEDNAATVDINNKGSPTSNSMHPSSSSKKNESPLTRNAAAA